MQKRALIVAGAAGPDTSFMKVLQRFGITEVNTASTISAALTELLEVHYDLVIVPLQQLEQDQLLTLERQIRKGRLGSIVGTAPQADPDLILRAMRAGIQEFVLFPPDPNDLAAAVDRLVRRNRSESETGQVVAVYSSKGGLGTTTVAVNVAQAYASQHGDARVALVDLVVNGGDVRLFLNLKPTYDVSDLARKLDHVDADLLYSLLTPRAGGVWALPAGESPELEEIIDESAVGSIIEQLRAHFALTVIDCEHALTGRTLAALDAADRVILVTQLTVPALRSTQRTLALCRRLGYTDQKLCVVVNRFQSGEVLSVRDATDLLKIDLFWKLPNDYKLTAAAVNRGVPVVEENPAAKLSKSYAQLAAKIGGMATRGGAERMNGHRPTSRFARLFGAKKGD
jgi:pilus assembly protein CpaE